MEQPGEGHTNAGMRSDGYLRQCRRMFDGLQLVWGPACISTRQICGI
jgi:hypothetical protein